ncbi:MAG: type 1 periplasmic binding fold superfamily protein [Sphingobacteriales bacterium]|nr:type 1 periplasmic binding fold superfamily protein [Sphingobacteriales bacterium]
MMNNKFFLFCTFLLFISVANTSCKKDDPIIPNEEELITTLIYTLTPTDSSEAVVFSFKDTDGDGGAAPVIISDTLAANTLYSGTLQLRNDQNTPATDISAEVLAEAGVHQFFYTPSATLQAVVQYNDTDADGKPVGVATKLQSGAVSNGTLTIVLRHEPDKYATGVAAGNPANAGGETDISVTFDVYIQ